jgi:hypothetical protein
VCESGACLQLQPVSPRVHRELKRVSHCQQHTQNHFTSYFLPPTTTIVWQPLPPISSPLHTVFTWGSQIKQRYLAEPRLYVYRQFLYNTESDTHTSTQGNASLSRKRPAFLPTSYRDFLVLVRFSIIDTVLSILSCSALLLYGKTRARST